MIDRLEPTKRPIGKNDGTQRWESLLFCHWEIAPEALRPHVPSDLELDLFDGRAYIGIVPFRMRAIRPSWLPRGLAFNFLETNVRTYVSCNDRPGVYFFSLDASSRLAVMAARLGWALPYFHATMSDELQGDCGTYASHRRDGRAGHRVSFRVGERLGESAIDTLEHFLFERYLLFVQRKGTIHCGQVHHTPYEVYNAEVVEIEDHLIGAARLPDLGKIPCLANFPRASMLRCLRSAPAFQNEFGPAAQWFVGSDHPSDYQRLPDDSWSRDQWDLAADGAKPLAFK